MAEYYIVAGYGVALCLLALSAIHRLTLAHAAHRLPHGISKAPMMGTWPTVLIQLPIYNEPRVVRRLLASVCLFDYPPHLVTLQVLDDSTDGTPTERWVRDLAPPKWNTEVIRRTKREGFKAGALAHGLARSDAELVVLFDADFVPRGDFLKLLVPEFCDAGVGMVQARWGHLNRHDGLIAEAGATLLDGHFLNEHAGRAAMGCFFNFNGTAGIWRRRCIDDAGGWLSRTLTEDLDLSYRAQLAGWRFVFRPDVVVPAELPAHVSAFKVQQHRWAKGSIETAKLLLQSIWQANLPWRTRFEATVHLLANMAYPLFIGFALLQPLLLWVWDKPAFAWLWWFNGLLFMGAMGAVIAFYVMALWRGCAPRRSWYRLPLTLAIGSGLAVNNSLAMLEAVLGRISPFVRTPKRGDGLGPGAQSVPVRMTQVLMELALGMYVSLGIGVGWAMGQYFVLPFLGLTACGFLILGCGSLMEIFLRRQSNANNDPHAVCFDGSRTALRL